MDVSIIMNMLNHHNERIKTLQGDVKKLDGGFNMLEGRVGSLNKILVNLTKQMGKINEGIKTIKEKVTRQYYGLVIPGKQFRNILLSWAY